jgi:hypothetical protein
MLSVTLGLLGVVALICRESSRTCRAPNVVADARAFGRVDAEPESEGLTRVDGDEIPDRLLRETEDSRVERWTCGGRASRETKAGFDELAALAAPRLTSG